MAKAFSVLFQQYVTVTIERDRLGEAFLETVAAAEGVDVLSDELLAQLVVQDIASGSGRFDTRALGIDLKPGAVQVELAGG
ncbi:hypothetical protein V7S57_02240 [Caulobacter sp. CCNWLY153]|uniref:hypothetical protein n=1 Tax=unclassified Caulobacter TaxID=2648921 RepID=UPI002FF32106